MKRLKSLYSSLAAAVALVCLGAPVRPAGRHILLSEGGVPGRVRFFSQSVALADDAPRTWVTVTRAGNFSDPRYGDFSITLAQLQQMVENFNSRTLGQDVFVDVAHKPNDGAAGRIVQLAVENGKLRALVEWTAFGRDAIKQRGFTYLSAEYHENFIDNEHKRTHGCVLLGAGLTTRPVIRNLEPVLLSQADDGECRLALSSQLLFELTESPVNYLEQLKVRLLALGLSDQVVTRLLAEAQKQFDAVASDQVRSLALVSQWEASGRVLAAQLQAHGGASGQPVIQLSTPTVDVAAEVARQLAARDETARNQEAGQAAKLKLLADTVAAGDPTLTPEGVARLSADYVPLISAATPDAQVLHLAQLVVKQAKALSAAQKLVTLGYNPVGGAVHISVDSSNSIKALQQEVDRRLGFDRLTDQRRYARTRGVLLAENRDFAERALAEFDARNGHRLDAEHRALAAGTGLVSDVAVPVVAERTVLREALYGLTSLNLVNTGTAPFAQVLTIPYSYRDLTAAGASALRRYEGQGIRKAGVIQTQEEARPIPQKLAFEVSAELRLLMSASPIDFDPVAENVRNIIRIVSEDTEALNMNELLCSADEAGVATRTDTLTASVDGSKSIFVTTKFPVVRPRKVYDLQGIQVGSTLNPITVTLNGTARSEFYVPADGSALPNGTYWVMNYNLGELRFVDQAGAPVVPTNGWALTVAYAYSTNAVIWSTDLPNGVDIKDHYDGLLNVIGGRKAVIESDRYYAPNMVLMSATVDNAVSQARSFEANASRVATGLAADGSVGQIKGLPAFNSTAPGLMLGDTRIMVGERGNTRFRMVKPFAMNPPEQSRNANGQFVDKQEAFGTQYVVSHTPTQLKNSLSSVVLYSATGRVAR